ncbi:MAG: hypothetical protein C0483_03875 [Pirellula sp.]|nr:hypothetical protein [Pirellula sp.]
MRPTIFLPGMVLAAMVAAAPACQPQAPAPAPPATTADGTPSEPAIVALIEPGTKIDPKALPPGTHLVFRSQPKLTSGDVTKVGKSIREALQEFTTLVLVDSEPDPNKPGQFRRKGHRIGIGKPKEGVDVVITRETAGKVGVSLGLFERKLLSEREKELSTVKSPGASPTMAMFDFTFTFVRDGARVPVVARYMALVEPQDGNLKTAYWVLDAAPEGNRFHGDTLQVLPQNHVMDWEMHVDGSTITFGAPQSDTFASTKLPEGKPLPAPAEFRNAAAAKAYSPEAAARLEQQLRALLKN